VVSVEERRAIKLRHKCKSNERCQFAGSEVFSAICCGDVRGAQFDTDIGESFFFSSSSSSSSSSLFGGGK